MAARGLHSSWVLLRNPIRCQLMLRRITRSFNGTYRGCSLLNSHKGKEDCGGAHSDGN